MNTADVATFCNSICFGVEEVAAASCAYLFVYYNYYFINN